MAWHQPRLLQRRRSDRFRLPRPLRIIYALNALPYGNSLSCSSTEDISTITLFSRLRPGSDWLEFLPSRS
jgi:hypothetical protein